MKLCKSHAKAFTNIFWMDGIPLLQIFKPIQMYWSGGAQSFQKISVIFIHIRFEETLELIHRYTEAVLVAQGGIKPYKNIFVIYLYLHIHSAFYIIFCYFDEHEYVRF